MIRAGSFRLLESESQPCPTPTTAASSHTRHLRNSGAPADANCRDRPSLFQPSPVARCRSLVRPCAQGIPGEEHGGRDQPRPELQEPDRRLPAPGACRSSRAEEAPPPGDEVRIMPGRARNSCRGAWERASASWTRRCSWNGPTAAAPPIRLRDGTRIRTARRFSPPPPGALLPRRSHELLGHRPRGAGDDLSARRRRCAPDRWSCGPSGGPT